MTRKKIIIILAVIGILSLVIVYSLIRESGDSGKEVYTKEAKKRDIVSIVSATGTIEAKKRVEISSDVIGKIERLNVKEGDRITKGEVLLRLDSEEYKSDVNRLKASLNQAKIEKEEKKLRIKRQQRHLKRQKNLYERGIISEDNIEQLELELNTLTQSYKAAKESVKQVESSLEKARETLNDTVIRAPISGKITTLNAEEGETVMTGTMNNPGTIIMIISDLDKIIAKLEVDETDITDVEEGQKAFIEVESIANKHYTGRVTKIGSSARKSEQRVSVFEVEITLDDPDKRLKPGMSVDGNIETGRKSKVLAVPIQSVQEKTKEDDNRVVNRVFILKDNKAGSTEVETGLSDDTHIEITGGLKSGDKIITGPYRVLRKLEDGETVRIKEIKAFGES